MAAAAAAVAAACRRAASYTLTGPPAEFFRVAAAATTVDKARAPSAAAAGASDKYAHLLPPDAGFKTPDTTPPPAKTRTENNSPTFASSGDPCLDFFFHVVPDTPPESVAARLADAWAREPLTALRLACNLRGVRGTGKSDREGFYAAALWMHERHTRTLELNARAVAGFGYLKDLPEILHRIIHGGIATTRPAAASPATRRRSTTATTTTARRGRGPSPTAAARMRRRRTTPLLPRITGSRPEDQGRDLRGVPEEARGGGGASARQVQP